MGFLRRLFGGPDPVPDSDDADPTTSAPPDDPDALERAYERDLLRAEGERLDALRERQLRYAAYAWQPPTQGGTRRADDADGDDR